MDQVKDWLNNFNNNSKLDYNSLLLLKDRVFELSLSGYVWIEIDDGKKIYELLDKIVKTNTVDGYNKKKVVYIDIAACMDKGFNGGLKKLLKNQYNNSVPIIIEISEDIDTIFMKKCKIIEEKKEEIILNNITKIKNKHDIEIYKRHLLMRCIGINYLN